MSIPSSSPVRPRVRTAARRTSARRFTRYLTLLTLMLLAMFTTSAVAQHVANPFVGATQYLNPDYTNEVNSAIATVTAGSALAQQMATVATYPTAVWMDHMGAIAGPNSGRLTLAQHISAALAQQSGTNPIVMEIVIYDLPDRDCAALASNGEISIAGNGTLTGIQEYEQDYITPIYNVLQPYASNSNIRFVLIIEPDSLPNMVTNTGIGGAAPISNCVAANNGQDYGQGLSMQGVYVEGIQYALNTFHQLPNVYQYLDIGQSAWLGWSTNMDAAAPFYNQIVVGTTAGYASVDGFISDTANYIPVVEPYFTGPTESIGGNEVESSLFFQYDPDLDELDYIQGMYSALTSAGFPSTVGFLIDTSRDGWGNTATRPTGPSTSTVLNTFVDDSKLDQRPVRGVWCNIADSGLGIPPVANPTTSPSFSHLEAYVWIKPPGESDGNYPGSTYGGVTSTTGDPNCNPSNTNPLAGGATDSLANSPAAGTFWIPEFTMYVQNAYPVVPTTGGTNPTPSFTMSASAGTLSVAQGGSASDTITITDQSGFTGSVTLDATGLPSGVTSAFGTNPTTGTSDLTLTASSSAAVTTSPATITITGTSGSLTASTTIALTITSSNSGIPGNGVIGAGVSPAASVCAVNSTVPIPAYGYTDYYTFQNNEWNSTATQCASVSGFGFDLTTANFNQTALGAPAEYTPATYPSIFWGCHWGNCTTGSTLPIQESALTSSTSSVSTVEPSGYTNDVAYDIWFNTTPTTSGQPNGTEIMIWINHAGSAGPFGSQVGTTTIDGTSWQVWTGRQTSWNIITYVQVPGNTVATNLNLMPFYQYATTLSVNGSLVLEPAWYLIDIEFGFEIWDGGQNLSLTGFSASASSAQISTGPVISSLSPTSGAAGSSTTINGSNLGSSDIVSFGSTAATVTSSSSTALTVTVPSSLASGAYNVTVTANGTTSSAGTFTVTGTTSTATVSASPSSSSVVQGASATSTITVAGFSGSATLATSGLPTGVTASFATNPTTSSSVLTLNASSTATIGAFTIDITGTSGSQTASTTFNLAITSSSTPTGSVGTGYWHTSGNQILDANNSPVRMAGINWYGFETSSYVANGLWAQDYKSILNDIKTLGYNVIRLPFSNQVVESNPTPGSINFGNGMNSDLVGLNSLQIMDKIVSYAGSIGLRMILDNHRSEAGNSAEANGLWYTSAYPQSAWLNDWSTMVNRYQGFTDASGNPTVIGVDLRNEPHLNIYGALTGSCWGCGTPAQDWHLAAQLAGNEVLGINPHLLIFVEGNDCFNGDCDWWGGNLEGAATYPVQLNIPNQLVYSAHDYGPNIFVQTWFNSSTTYTSLTNVWTKFWAYLSINNVAPVWVGEFGTTNVSTDIENTTAGSQGQWFQSLVQFLQSNPKINWTYWALNGEDAYGLLDNNYDPTPVSALKQQLLAGIQFPLNGGGSGGGTTAPSAPTGLAASATSSSQINLTWTASSTSGVTYSVYSSTSSGFTPSTSNLIASGLSATSYSDTGLTASTAYYYVVTAVNTSGTSANSNQASATTQASGSTPPAAPTGLAASATSSSQINLTWTASTTSGVTYSVLRNGTTIASKLTSTSYSDTGLTASTAYSYIVDAVDAGGTTASSSASATTQAGGGGAGGCTATYANTNDWGTGFQAAINITNNGSSAISSWTLTWTFSGNQQLSGLWNGVATQSGQNVTVTNESYNGTIAAGGNYSGQIGFTANYSGSNVSPTVSVACH